ncbi:cdkn1a interacting zinc finger protein 1b isoform X2 [Platichthys flesus]|uniref:cdkn1a interacting zinc finger protein 1b isoform X2 n=1 Tax=Platichthys flesus TaxID=8260 RepID=UPI002DB87B12|nr:cdkn1a interacting zinc finger protein 1b isoform X2 [Platichthys flesus]
MVKQQQRRTDSVAQVRFLAGSIQRRPPSLQGSGRQWAGSGTGSAHSWPHGSRSTTTEEERATTQGALGPDGGSGETKRARLDGVAELSALVPTSCDQAANQSSLTPDGVSCRVPPLDQLGAAGLSEDSRAAELQSVGSLKVTIQRSSESREFGQTDRTAETQTGGLHCHVCNLTCRSVQVFHEHMSGAEHMKKLQEITHCIGLNTHTKQDRGLRPHTQRWCDSCQTHFSDDVIVHRQTKHHKMCKQLCRPFCPVCKRHFRTPRKFVEHMKSPEHKQKVHQQEAQEEELITVDAVGCFEGEKEEVEQEEEEEVEQEEGGDGKNEAADEKVLEAADTEDYNPHTTYGSSFVVPVSGFLCRLCNKFFQRETTARHTHCRTRKHYLNLQRSQKKPEDEDTPVVTGPAHTVSHHAPVL